MTNNDGYKLCGDCKENKSYVFFYKKLNSLSNRCKACTKIYNKKYRENHLEELNEYRKYYYCLHQDDLIKYGKKYRADPKNKRDISLSKKEYLKNNKDIIYERVNKRRKIRRKEDPSYRLRNLISRSVSRMLKQNLTSKKGGSIKSNLLYSIDELKKHLESKFEPWMNWGNQGKYIPQNWDDKDQSTWTWQLDHIIPQYDLPYKSMEDENFKKCWSLENLRPLSAKQNILDRNRKK